MLTFLLVPSSHRHSNMLCRIFDNGNTLVCWLFPGQLLVMNALFFVFTSCPLLELENTRTDQVIEPASITL